MFGQQLTEWLDLVEMGQRLDEVTAAKKAEADRLSVLAKTEMLSAREMLKRFPPAA